MTQGWLGGWESLKETLDRMGVDQNEEGAYAVQGISSFMGAGDEYLVITEAVARVDGQWVPLYPELPTEGTVKGITVIC
jgi:hypothetical protein